MKPKIEPPKDLGLETAAPKKRGRKPSGLSRAEIENRSAKAHRQSLLERGLVEMKIFVKAETREKLTDEKIVRQKTTLGEVIDEIVDEILKYRSNKGETPT